MQTPIIQQIRNLTIQLNEINIELSNTKSDKKIKSLLRRNNKLIQKRKKLASQLGLTSWESEL